MKQSKIKQAQSVEIKRSEIHLAEYNPRKISEESRKLLKANLKKVGVMGGIVYNKTTGNIVSGHQKVSILDEVNKYDENDLETDYMLRVDVVELDLQTEKEQNLFMNNRKAQGEYDDDMLREMLSDIDYKSAGFDDFDMEMLGLEVVDLAEEEARSKVDAEEKPKEERQWRKEDVTKENKELAEVDKQTKETEENTKINRKVDFYEDTEENQLARHNEVAKIKERINNKSDLENDGGMLSYVILSFNSPSEKMAFMEQMHRDPMEKTLQASYMLERVDIIDIDGDYDAFSEEESE